MNGFVDDFDDIDKSDYMPLEVTIQTDDHDIKGLVHVSRSAREDRRLSDLLNDPSRRFLAITDAELRSRRAPSSPRRYKFMQIRVETINMIHPSMESVAQSVAYTPEDSQQFEQLRGKISRDS